MADDDPNLYRRFTSDERHGTLPSGRQSLLSPPGGFLVIRLRQVREARRTIRTWNLASDFGGKLSVSYLIVGAKGDELLEIILCNNRRKELGEYVHLA